MVPKNLTNEQKENRRNVRLDLLENIESENFFKHVITGDESWIIEYDPKTKQQSSEWHRKNSLHLKKARMSKSKIKSMLTCFFRQSRCLSKGIRVSGQTVKQ
jgi:hypothetical protein